MRTCGATAMEILIALMLLTLLGGIAAPSFLGVIERYRVRTAAWELAGHLQLARQRAVMAKQRTRMLAIPAGAAATPNTYILEREEGAAYSGHWRREGFRVQLPPDVTLLPTSAAAITFGLTGAADPGTVMLENAGGRYAVVVNVVGRVRVCRGDC